MTLIKLATQATLSFDAIVARIQSRRRHDGGGGGLFAAQPTLVWPCKQPSRVALHGSVDTAPRAVHEQT